MPDYHLVPVDDVIVHDSGGDGCICGPTTKPVERDDGSIGWMQVHHSLDGRELTEPDRRQVSSHRHVLVLHRHPDWHGHCNPHKRGFKRCDRWHWHVWYRHVH